MCTSHGTDRRTFLSRAGLITAGTALATATAATQAAAQADEPADWRPDPDSNRFTLVVMPDTQYLFDGPSIQRAPVEASLRYVLDHGRDDNIVFLAHLGDLTEHGTDTEFAAVGEAFELLDRNGVGYSVLTGNHDIPSRTDDQRGATPYLRTFGPDRMADLPTFGGATPDGYNTYHLIPAAGREWLVLALDWRMSEAGFAWARQVIADHPESPVILTTHDLVGVDEDKGGAVLSDYGQRLWSELIHDHDQIFLTLNGHFWPAARTVRENAAGNDVHLHLTNYQNRYYGGAAMIRLYHFDLDRDTIDVETVSPWILGRAADGLNELERGEIELTGPDDRFSVAVDFAERFAGFAPVAAREPRPAAQLLVPGTLAYWRFDGREDGARAEGPIRDLTGRGNDLTVVAVPGSSSRSLTFSAAHHPDQPGHGSLRFAGGKPPLQGAYLRTVQGAPLNAATFPDGYTIEAFYQPAEDWDSARNAWGGLVGRTGTGGAAGKTQDDPDEPLATLSLSDGPGPQWAVRPLNQEGIATNWGDETAPGRWWHVAVVNDGSHTTMYVQGCPVARNPHAAAVGLTSVGLPWLLGGYEYGGRIDQILNGRLGDVRICDRALAVGDFMLS
ncbi:LamG-like jellyroll fold domain-containing protein [Streptomyces sp. NPDC055681]